MSRITTLIINPDAESAPIKPLPEHFEKAADLIEKRWTKGTIMDDHGNYCMLGALGKVVANAPMYGYNLEKAWGLRVEKGDEGWFAVEWNDNSKRRRRDVVGLLRRTAKQLRRQQEAN